MTLKVAERKDSQNPLIHSREHNDENSEGELEFLFAKNVLPRIVINES